MKMTLPFKPHVLALICSAGLCAASTGLYKKPHSGSACGTAIDTTDCA